MARDLLRQSVGNLDVSWNAPVREGDRDEQIRIIERLIMQKVDGLLLAPFDAFSLIRPVEEAAGLGIPTVIVDSLLETSTIVSFVATDNRAAGSLAADRMSNLVANRGRVLLLRYQKESVSTKEREEGFLWQIRRIRPDLDVLISDQYAGTTRDSARIVSEALLSRHGSYLNAVFTPNESSTAGMLLALQAAKMSSVAAVGFDASDIYLHCLRDGRLQGLVVQDPFRMGELGLVTLVEHLQGKMVRKRIVTNAVMVTPENVDDAAFSRLLHPSG